MTSATEVPVPYCTVDDAKAAGAVGTDEEIEAAIRDAGTLVDVFTRSAFSPRLLTQICYTDAAGWGRLGRPTISVECGTLYGSYRWLAPLPGGQAEWAVPGVVGMEFTPTSVVRATARLAAMLSPAPFSGQADEEGQPIGRPPAPSQSDLTDPAPPVGTPSSRTTGDPVADQWLAPFRTNQVLT
jgi:hypothetical protein